MAKKKRRKKKKINQELTSSASSSKQNVIQQGLNYFNRGEYPKAIRSFNQASKMSSEVKSRESGEKTEKIPQMLAEAYFRRAVSLYSKGQARQVISELHQAVQHNPKSGIYFYHLGLAYHRNGNLDRAIPWYQRALEAEPSNSRFQYHLAIAYMESGRFPECQETLKQVNDAMGDYGMALSLLLQENPEAVLKLFENKDEGYALFFKGVACMMLDDYKQAKAELRNAVKIEPDCDMTQYYLGIAYAKSNNLFSAVKTWESIKDDGVKNLVKDDLMDIYRKLSAEYVKKDALDKSVKIWEKMLKLNPENEIAKNNLVRAYFLEGNRFAEQDNLKHAISRWERVAQLAPDNADVMQNLALAHDKLEDPWSANQYWGQVVSLWKQDLRSSSRKKKQEVPSTVDKETLKKQLNLAHRHLADNYLQIDRLDKAIGEYRNATSYLPDDTDSLLEMGKLHLFQERFSNAIKEFQKALKFKPNDVEILSHIAFANVMNGKPEQAMKYFEKILELEPQNEIALEQLTGCCREEAMNYCYQGRYEHAFECIRRALKYNPNDCSLLAFMGGIHLERDDIKAAEEIFKNAIDINPNDPNAYAEIGHFYLQEAMADEAEEYFDKAMEIGLNDPMVLISIGRSYCSVEEIKEAEGYFDIAVEHAEKDPQIYLTIAAALIEQEVPRLAQKYLKQGTKAIPNAPAIRVFLAQAYLQDDKISNAQQELNKALRSAREQNNPALVQIIEQMLVAISFSDLFSGLFIDEEDDDDDDNWELYDFFR